MSLGRYSGGFCIQQSRDLIFQMILGQGTTTENIAMWQKL